MDAWDRHLLKELPAQGSVIPANDARIETYAEDTMMRGAPDAVLVARDEEEIRDVLALCNGNGIPVTFCGSQTSMTGSSVAMEGLLVSTEKLEGVLDIGNDADGAFAIVRPGIVVADLQKAVANAGFFYPVAPTSRDECRIGANVATNATGEDSFKYGPVRHYVQALDIVLPDGTLRTLARESGECPSWERNRAGYFTGWKHPIDLVIGSEGTLAFISRITLRLLRAQPPFFSALIPLPSDALALNFVLELALEKKGPQARTLELIDSGALRMMRTAEGFPQIPDEVQAFLYIKQEYADDAKLDHWLERWYEAALPFSGEALLGSLLIATTREEQERFRLWRHRIPEAANEFGRSYWSEGGGKVGSDWWVPMPRLQEMMAHFYAVATSTGLPFMGYAHIGAGHPHTNFLAKNPAEKARAHEALLSCCRKAVELGGGVAGEHGIGKLHTDLLPIQHSQAVIEQMKAWKREYDPKWVLGRGTIFSTIPEQLVDGNDP